MNLEDTITITDSAVKKVFDLIQEEDNQELKLRVFVQGGGCSGFQYGFTFDELMEDDDLVVNKIIGDNSVNFLIDPMSFQYLQNSVIDYTSSLEGEQFVIKNPNATTTCGCGSSFSV